ncbi:MAG: OmpA family protein [Steroidobacteraceae bacterium]
MWLLQIASLLCLFAVVVPAKAQTAPGTLITNSARIDYFQGATALQTRSNTVSVTVQATSTPSAVSILRFAQGGTAGAAAIGPTLCRNAGSYTTLAPPVLLDGTILGNAQSTPLDATSTVHGGEPLFIRLIDADQNRNPALRDTIDLQITTAIGDTEVLRLTETGPDSGEFVGYIATATTTAAPGDCTLQVARNETLAVSYSDPVNAADTSSASALVDPYGMVFDSSTGTPVDGARVRLVNTQTGQDAQVLGDDGVSRYPATVVTGSAATDAGGTSYSLPPGVFRFPLVAPGSYRLTIDPPAGYGFPSVVQNAALQLLAGAPFRISAGSYGLPFTASAPPAVAALDVPLDPTGTRLYLQKTTNTAQAALGDLVQYTLTVQNAAGTGPFRSASVTDRLPPGLRLRAGSVRLNGNVAPDPTISADGHTLVFTTGQIDPGARMTIQYVVEVVAGARGRRLTNTASALAQEGVRSNDATATIQLREELFSDAGIIVGRVMQASCEQTGTGQPGVAGIRVYLEDGRYALTDEEGKYHFEGVKPGTHVVQLDTTTVAPELEVRWCSDEVRHAGRGWSQFVELRAGSLWRADFRLAERAPPTGNADLQLSSQASDTSTVQHTLQLRAGAVPLQGLRLRVLLPAGLEYVDDSAIANGAAVANPQITDGLLNFLLGAVPADGTLNLTLRTRLRAGSAGDLTIKAFATFATAGQLQVNTATVANTLQREAARFESSTYRFAPHFPVLQAQLLGPDRDALTAIAAQWRGVLNIDISAVGHTDRTPIARANRAQYADNYALSLARAQAVADYLRDLLGTDAAHVHTLGKGPDEPLSAGHDAASLATNRRVDITITGDRQRAAESLTVVKADERGPKVDTIGSWKRASHALPVTLPASRPDADVNVDIESMSNSMAWVLPAADTQPAIPSIKVAIAHAIDQSVALEVNGQAASALDFDGISHNLAGTVALSRWRGVDLVEGENLLRATIRDADGHEVGRLERSVHYGDGAVHAELVHEQSVLAADGTTRPIIALRMVDRFGKPARNGTIGGYTVDAPYRSWFEVQTLHDNQLVALGRREPTFEVGSDGVARIELEPTAQAGTVVLHLRYSERHQQELHVWLEPQARDWVMVGVASGTLAYSSISHNMQAAADAGVDDGYSSDGRMAFFAKGAIQGKYLLTAAFDSQKSADETPRLLGTIEPDRYYTIYGDGTQQRFEAPSSEKLYLKIERGQFYAMFGDYQTGLTVTDLSRYNRTFTGLKTEYSGQRYGFTGFATNSDQNFVRDELPGDGTSGLYRLTHADIIINSDKLRIEVRDRIRSELIVATRTLSRYLDYSIDYLNGTIFFRQPVASRDENFNPQTIVVEYETAGGAKSVTAGGRVSIKSRDQHFELGSTLIEQGADAGNTLLGGLDLRWNATESTRLRAELAHSDSNDPARRPQATAYLAELQHVTERVDARGYIREQQPGFGVEQQRQIDAGARRIGADGRVKLDKFWNIRGEAYREDVLDSGNNRSLVSAEVRREDARHVVDAGLRHVADQSAQNGSQVSDQAFVGGSLTLRGDQWRLRARQEFAMGGRAASVDFPTRSLLGVDYRWTRNTTFFTDYEHSSGSALHSDTTRAGVRSTPWDHAQIQSSIAQQFTEFGPRLFSTVGLTQGWQPNPRWTYDFGIDQTRTLRGTSLAPLNPRVPLASGTLTGDFFASFVGALYRTPLWTFSSRVENRHADTEERWLLTSGFYREPLRGHAFSLAANLLDSNSRTAAGSDSRAALLRLSWAFRPLSSDWIVLDRLDLKYEQSGTGTTGQRAARLVNNFNSNWQLDPRSQLGLQLGVRYTDASFSSDHYSGIASLLGLDYRRDLSGRFDIGAHATTLQSWSSHLGDSALGFDLGVTVAKNVWISLGYNLRGYADRDFSANRYTAAGPFLTFRIKADQDTFKDLSLASLRPQH